MVTIKVWNKTETKTIKFRIKDAGDARMLMGVLARNGYGFVLSGDEEEGDDHGYKDNNRQ